MCAWSHSASEDASNSRLFRVATGISAVSSPHPHPHSSGCGINIPPHAPDSVGPGAADIVSGWDSLTYPRWCWRRCVSADGHSSAGLVSLADSSTPAMCVSLCAHVVKILLLNHSCTPPLSSPLPTPFTSSSIILSSFSLHITIATILKPSVLREPVNGDSLSFPAPAVSAAI